MAPSEVLHAVNTLGVAASHEINNPLMALIASLELLERTQTLDADGRTSLAVALAAAWEIKEKVHQLGRITRFELTNGGPDRPSMLDLEKSGEG